MPLMCNCGTLQVEGARFCHRCGKPQGDFLEEPEPEPVLEPAPVQPDVAPLIAQLDQVMLSEISFHNQPAVVVALLAALCYWASSFIPLPVVLAVPWRILTLFACGFLAVVLYSRRTGTILTVRNGARMGWLMGIFCFAMGAVFMAISMVALSTQGNFWDIYRKMLIDSGQSTHDVDQAMQALQDPAVATVGILFIMGLIFFFFVLLPAIGGMLGAKVLEKE